MSNKKLFWLAFFILSIFEFGQFAYSKNTSEKLNEKFTSHTAIDCDVKHSTFVVHTVPSTPSSYSLPISG